MDALFEKVPGFVWVIIVLLGYAAIVFYRVKGIPKTLLTKVIEAIENKAKSSDDRVKSTLDQLKFEIDRTMEADGLKDTMDILVSDTVHKEEPRKRVSKGKRFLNGLANIAKIALMFRP